MEPDLVVQTSVGLVLQPHRNFGGKWHTKRGWIFQKGKLKEEWANVTVSVKTRSLFWGRCLNPGPLSLKFRILGVLSGPHLQKSVENRNCDASSAARDTVDRNTWFCTVKKRTICVQNQKIFVSFGTIPLGDARESRVLRTSGPFLCCPKCQFNLSSLWKDRGLLMTVPPLPRTFLG